jgi:predicted  nucleic acid-binding Zn-ribbon protein
MEHKEIARLHAEIDDELESVAARIRPLPREVAPSPEFMTRTRLRLLQLKPEVEARDNQRAA